MALVQNMRFSGVKRWYLVYMGLFLYITRQLRTQNWGKWLPTNPIQDNYKTHNKVKVEAWLNHQVEHIIVKQDCIVYSLSSYTGHQLSTAASDFAISSPKTTLNSEIWGASCMSSHEHLSCFTLVAAAKKARPTSHGKHPARFWALSTPIFSSICIPLVLHAQHLFIQNQIH